MSDSDDLAKLIAAAQDTSALDATLAEMRASGELDGGDDEPRTGRERWPIPLTRGEIRGLLRELEAEHRNERTR